MTDLQPAISLRFSSDHAEWMNCYSDWLGKLPDNTTRAYNGAWKELTGVSGKMPWELDRSDVVAWVRMMNARGLANSTISQRLAAISSYFTYLKDTTGIKIDITGGKVLRPKVRPFRNARYLSIEAVRALLGAMNPNTKRGSRDYALFLTYIMTGRRNSEIRNLKWGDIVHSGATVFYRWQGKGKGRLDELPRPCFNAITNYLKTNARLETIGAEESIFVASSDCAKHLPSVKASAYLAGGAISMHQVEDLLRTYKRKAGIVSQLRVHDLRHTAAMLRRAAGDDVEKISEFLAHSDLGTTQVYLHKIAGRQDTTWMTVGQMLGIGDTDEELHTNKVAQNNVKSNRE